MSAGKGDAPCSDSLRQAQAPLQRPQVIRKRVDFLAANGGKRVAKPGFILLVSPNDGPQGGRGRRYGITVTKRIGNAVTRNRMKRRFRELLWDSLPERGFDDHDHILIGRERGIERDFARLRGELSDALRQIAEGRADPPRRGRGRRGHAKQHKSAQQNSQ